MSTEVNKPLSLTEDLFKSLVWEPAIKAATVSYPILAIWPISAFIKTISNYIFSGVAKVVDLGAIKLLNAEHESAFIKASVTLIVIAHDKGVESAEFKNAHNQALIALSRFTRINS